MYCQQSDPAFNNFCDRKIYQVSCHQMSGFLVSLWLSCWIKSQFFSRVYPNYIWFIFFYQKIWHLTIFLFKFVYINFNLLSYSFTIYTILLFIDSSKRVLRFLYSTTFAFFIWWKDWEEYYLEYLAYYILNNGVTVMCTKFVKLKGAHVHLPISNFKLVKDGQTNPQTRKPNDT